MSAYVVSRRHIDVLVSLALHGPSGVPVSPAASKVCAGAQVSPGDGVWHPPDSRSPDDLGALLIAANVGSVAYRYPGDAPDELPGPVERYYLEPYTYARPDVRPSPVEGLAALDCYVYQSCERPDWETSEACRLVDRLRDRLIHRLPGYSEAPWAY